MAVDASDFFERYLDLVQQASDVHLVPAGGVTPRELQRQLESAAISSPTDLARLTCLIEQCIYGCQPDSDRSQEGIALCESVLRALPEVESPAHPSQWARHAAVLRILMPWLFIAAGIGLLVFLLANAKFARPEIAVSTPTASAAWSSTYENEARAARASETSWRQPASNPTWVTAQIDTTLDARQLAAAREPGIDTVTSVDGSFENATDPFHPPLNWTHRLHVFTYVDGNYAFRASGSPSRDATGTPNNALRRHTANVQVRLRAWQPVPIPSPAPDAVVTAYSCTAGTMLKFFKDEGDGLYVVGNKSGVVRVQYALATWQDYSFAPLPDVPFVPQSVPIPESVRADAAQVIQAIDDLPQESFRGTVRRLHQYFAGFSVAPIANDEVRANSYLTVALSRKGVCRHRARAFFITANALGVETRLVENRTHSFCEVRLPDGTWRRMEFRFGENEGPPGSDTRAGDLAATATVRAILPGLALLPVMVALFFMFDMMHRRDIRGHVIHDSIRTPKALRRARRDASRVPRDESAPLIDHVRRQVALLRKIDPHDDDSFRRLTEDPSVPRSIRPRLRRLLSTGHLSSQHSSIDLQAAFWDCYYILQWTEGTQT